MYYWIPSLDDLLHDFCSCSKPLAKCIQVMYSGSLSQVKQIKVLLGNQGISIGCGPATHVYTLVIRDADVCNSFCSLISGKYLV